MSGNLWFSDAFRGYTNEALTQNRLIMLFLGRMMESCPTDLVIFLRVKICTENAFERGFRPI